MSVLEETDVKGPSLFGVAFFAVLFALIGALLCFMLLVSISPKPFNSLAECESHLEKNPESGLLNAYYFRGTSSSSKEWSLKRETFLTSNDTTLILTHSEINAWAASRLKKQKLYFSEGDDPSVFASLGVPNFFIDPTQGVHFSMLLEVVLFGKTINTLLIGRGHFAEDEPDRFHLSELRLNGAKIPFLEKLSDPLLDILLEAFDEDAEFVAIGEAWEKVGSTELVEDGIRLNVN